MRHLGDVNMLMHCGSKWLTCRCAIKTDFTFKFLRTGLWEKIVRHWENYKVCKSVSARSNARINAEGWEESVVHSAHGMKGDAHKKWWGKQRKRLLDRLRFGKKMMLQWILQMSGLKLWNGLNCSHVCPVTGFCKHYNRLGPIKLVFLDVMSRHHLRTSQRVCYICEVWDSLDGDCV
jgi:hypothetical protein